MLSVTKVKSSAKTTEYFAKDDYYASSDPNHQKFSNWYGKGAEELSLEGNVGAEDFKNILDGKLSNGQSVGVSKGMDLIHDAGRDLTFSAPKSVSIMALVYDDKELIEAHNQAVKNTLDEIEKNYLKTRVRKGDEVSLKGTGKMVAAMFRHELSRDLDPQLHTHTIIANLTSDEKGKWRSAFFDEIYDNKKFLGLIYRSELARLVKELGYEIEHKGKDCFFELKNIPAELNSFFSNRSKKIRSIADENTTQKELERITLKSRENKSVKEYEHNLGETWRQKAKEFLPDFNILKKDIINRAPVLDLRSDSSEIAKQAVDYAVKHLSERKTVFTRSELISTALNDTISKTTLRQISKAVDVLAAKNELLLVKKEGLEKNTYTTADLLSKENAIINMLIGGKNKHAPITSDLTKYSNELSQLNDGQKRSAELILTNKDMITGIQGFAGVGKTFMLNTVNQIAKSEGFKSLGLSPTGVATRNLNKAADIDSMTLQRFLMKYDGVAMGRGTKQGRVEMQQEFKDTIVFVDESSMISTVQMKNLLTISSELNFRLVLVGDRRQLDSVEAGVPFYEMQRNGMPFADMREIVRQKNPQLKSAVYSTIKRDIDKAFKEIEYDVHETKEVAGLAIKTLMEMSASQKNSSIILTPANETREEVNKEVSRLIYEERQKEINGKEYIQEIYKNKNLSEAEKTRAYRFRAGDVILFSKDRNYIGVTRNTYCEVVNVDTKQNLITIKTGLFKTQTFDPIKIKGKAAKNYFEVFSKTERIFREGDRIAFNRSIPELKVINSDGAILTKIDRSNFYLKLDSGNGKEVKIKKNSPQVRHLDHSYAVTAHKAQGLTCQTVIAICESTRDKLTSQKNFYVEISRAQERAIVITDDKAKVIEKLKENTGIEISAREHQDITHLGINMIKSGSKPQVGNPHVKNLRVEKQRLITNYNQHEIRDHFLEAIKSSIKLDASDVVNAIKKSIENKNDKIRFGKNKEYEICWHGEAGYVKNYKTGEFFKWGLNSIKDNKKLIAISEKDLAKNQEQERRDREAQEKQKLFEEKEAAINAKKYFAGFFKASMLNTLQNKYLIKKGINQKVIEGVRFTKDEKLVIPVQDTTGKIHSLQFVDHDGNKTFLKGGKKQGNFFMIDADKLSNSKEVYLAEGFATAASVNMATNKPVAVTFDAGNIEHVLKNLKESHPHKEFTIAADNDLWREHNVGREKAEFAAQKYGAKVVLPNFSLAHKDEMPTDFNDLHKLSGIHEVEKQIQSHQITHEREHSLHI